MFEGGFRRPRVFDGEPSYFSKEVHFFQDDRRFEKGISFYASRFENDNERGTGPYLDASPGTFTRPDRVRDTYEAAGGNQVNEVKFIVMLREPIARELSIYNHMTDLVRVREKSAYSNSTEWYRRDVVRDDGCLMSFDEFVEKKTLHSIKSGTNRGLYTEKLQDWFALFSREQILVLSYDEFTIDKPKIQERVQKFLGRTIPGEFKHVNSHSSPFKVREISPETRLKLIDAYKPHNEELYKLLDALPGPPMEQSPFPRFLPFEWFIYFNLKLYDLFVLLLFFF